MYSPDSFIKGIFQMQEVAITGVASLILTTTLIKENQ